MDEHAVPVHAVVGVAPHMVPFFQNEDLFIALLRKTAGSNGTGEAGTDNQCVKAHNNSFSVCSLTDEDHSINPYIRLFSYYRRKERKKQY